ncbi:MAG: hypothetical protein NTW14_00025, partial [bacterium]|nr:hypothetical protein [bacterium]
MKLKNTFRNAIIIAAMLMLPLAAFAQWSSNPMQNLGVAATTGDQATPKMVATSDSGCYICWFDSRSGRYCMYLQRLNSAGVPQWAQNGLLISDHTQMTSLVDYDMAVDQSNNAVIVFSDTRNGGTNELDVFAYKISPEGTFLWGADGIGLSPTVNADFEPAAKVTATNSGNFVFAWQKSGTTDIVCFQKLSSSGQKLWGENGFTIAGAASHALGAPDLVPADNDNVVVFWKDSTGPFWSPTTLLYTQKFDANGNSLWTAPGVIIYDLGHMSAWTYPEIISDQNGGAFYGWYDSPSLSDFSVKVAHVNGSGGLVFPLNGVMASTSSGTLHAYPSITYAPSADALYVFWVEMNTNQSSWGLYGQKFSPQGSRLWTDSGREYIGLGANQISFVSAQVSASGIYVGYFEAPGVVNNAVKALKVDIDGNLLWGPTLLSSADLGGKDDLLMVVNTENRAFLSWSDNRNDFADIYAQNVNADGSLGNQTATSLDVNTSAINPPVVIPANGGSFPYSVNVHVLATTPTTLSLWNKVRDSANQYTTVFGPVTRTLPGGANPTRILTQNIAGSISSGTLYFISYVGSYPNMVVDSSFFTITKSTVADGNPWITESYVTGDVFDEFATTDVGATHASPLQSENFVLLGAYPNPFNPTTTIR